MLASQLRHHPARTARQRGRRAWPRPATGWLSCAPRTCRSRAAFDLSYHDLTAGQQRLFRRLGLVPGPSFDAYAAAALDGTSLATPAATSTELYDQHLITEPAPGRYQLHDLLREHARTLATTTTQPPTQSRHRAAAGLLPAHRLGRRPALRHPGHRLPPAATRQPAGDAPDLSTLGQAAAWLEAERANLHAAADHAATHGRPRHAMRFPPR